MISTEALTALTNPTLATDLDGTFAHGDPGTRARVVAALREADGGCLLYVTGRSVAAWRELAAEIGLPTPALAITDVGTEVADGATGVPLDAFDGALAPDWPGPVEIESRLADLPGLALQPLHPRRRVSYTFTDARRADATLAAVTERLAGLPVDLLPSADMYLDVLPQGVNKGSTLLRVLAYLDRPVDTTVVAGDTLNDYALFATGLKGIVVGNAEAALKARLAGRLNVHFAAGAGVDGIAEGLAHFGLAAAKA